MRLVVLDGHADRACEYRGSWARRLHLEKVYRSARLIRLVIYKGPVDDSEEEAHIEIDLNELLHAVQSFTVGGAEG
jgi:hypothetical protein